MKGAQTNDDIQVLRAFAILYTVFAHFMPLQRLGLDEKYYCFLTGVDLFFCISGYVITKSLLKEFSGTITLGAGIKGFYIKRCTRLLPSAWLWLALPIAVQIVLDPSMPELRVSLLDAGGAFFQVANLQARFHHLLYVPGQPGVFPEFNGLAAPYWSLSLEEQFYVVAPLVIFAIFRKHWTWLWAVLLGVALTQFIYTKGMRLSGDWGLCLNFRVDAIIFGVLIGLSDSWLSRQWARISLRTRKLAARIIIPLGLLYLALMTSSYTLRFVPYQTGTLAIVCAVMVLAAVANGRALWAPVIGPALTWIGDRSYSIYLVHMVCLFLVIMILHVVTGLPLHGAYNNPYWAYPFWQWIALGGGAVVTALVAEANFRIVEVPIRNWGRAWAHRLRTRDAPLREQASPPVVPLT
jgi:peptidoglycan/LPS O-acetylase OafA/YrhL